MEAEDQILAPTVPNPKDGLANRGGGGRGGTQSSGPEFGPRSSGGSAYRNRQNIIKLKKGVFMAPFLYHINTLVLTIKE